MKTVVLLPARNEAWVLPLSLKNFSDFADHIIVADQHSTDSSLDIYKQFPKVTVIKNDEIGHGNKIRWNLLDEARKIGGNNLIICIDADELISPKAIAHIKAIAEKSSDPIAFEFSWIQLWKTTSKYRLDGVWKDNRKAIAFIDDGKVDYERNFVINDHTSRIPQNPTKTFIPDYPLLHLQFVAWNQTQMKQAWYRCSELVAGGNPKKINLKYSITFDSKDMILKDTPSEWLADVSLAAKSFNVPTLDWHYKEITDWFDQKGVEFFEPLEIWHIKELRDIFIERAGRVPRPKTYPLWLIQVNTFKNKVKGFMHR